MKDLKPTVPSTNKNDTSKARTWLIFAAVGTFAAIIFGLVYLFVLAPSVPDASAGWFLFSFATGLTMIVLPCTLPLAFVIVPLSMGKGFVRGISMALAFGIGIAITLSMYGVAAALLGGVAIDALGADLDVVKNWVYFVAGSFALLFALSEIGLLNVHMPTYKGSAPAFIQKRSELLKALMLGLFLGNVGVGCPHPATPLILIEIASSGDVLYGWLLFLMNAIGRILPLLLLAFLAILGVNGLNWLLARKDAVERATGWAMVFVAGFILTLGLFSHDWWVNSGIHSGLESITQEQRFNTLINYTLGTEVEHIHGLEEGQGLFGLPLKWGNWFLVSVWIFPMWWWYRKRKKEVSTGENPCDEKLLSVKRNFLILVGILLIVIFVYLLPNNFSLRSSGGGDHESSSGHDASGNHLNSNNEEQMDTTKNNAIATPFLDTIEGLPSAKESELVTLNDGDTYDITAGYIQKEVGNRTLRMMAYNGSVPGPFIKAPEGSEVTINFTNNTDLDQTIHSHGLRLDNNSDGVPGVTQDAVKPGETFVYTLKFNDAGVYWYHPHTRDDYGQEMGLYGNYLIEPSQGYNSPVNREIPLVIDDILIVDDKIATFYKEYTDFALLGRFGNEYLVNGEKDNKINVRTGEVIRFFITNVSNARTYNLSIPGTDFKLIAADVGRYEKEFYTKDFLISPAERMIAEVYFESPGTYNLTHTMPNGKVILTEFTVTGSVVSDLYDTQFKNAVVNQEVVDEFSNFRSYLDTKPDKKLLMTVKIKGTVDHSGHGTHGNVDMPDMQNHEMTMTNGTKGIQWDDKTQSDRINTTKNIEWMLVDQDTGKASMNIDDWVFTQGDLIKIKITNDPKADHVMQHPMHLHGQRFVVLSENGIPNENMAWKDTTLVLPGESIEILVEMSNLGEWMAHCHISEHLHAGMMLKFRVENENGEATGDTYRKSVMKKTGGVATLFRFDDTYANKNYTVEGFGSSPVAERIEEISFTIKDKNDNLVSLASTEDSLKVAFVDSTDTYMFESYPGNTEFDIPEEMMEGHDNSDGHHSGFINKAYADIGHTDTDEPTTQTGTYKIPVVFPTDGTYNLFVQFIPKGGTRQIITSYTIEVRENTFTVDNFGWSDAKKWWILFSSSIILIIPLVWLVRRFITVK